MKKSEILALIKEEVEVVLTNNEMIEFFDLDPAKLLDEMMLGEQEAVDVSALGKDRETGSARRARLRGAAADTGAQKGVTPQESAMLKMVLGVLEDIAKTDDLKKYRPLLIPLLKKLQQRTKGAGAVNEDDDKSFSKAAKEIEKKGTEGVFTAKAKKAGMGVQAYADKVLAKDSKASTKTKRQAAFAKGAATVARENK